VRRRLASLRPAGTGSARKEMRRRSVGKLSDAAEKSATHPSAYPVA
jgi:hypothetical protein